MSDDRASETTHANICISFELEGVRYEAVGFLQDGEDSVELREAIERAGETVVSGDEDWKRIKRGLNQLPGELLKFNWLVTNRPSPDYPSYVSCLDRSARGWRGDWSRLRRHWRRYGLVLRRCV